MTHKDREGKMQKNCKYGESCRSKNTCKDWHPRPARQGAAAGGSQNNSGGGGTGEKTDMQKAKMAYAREKRVALKTVDDSKVSGDMAQWLRKHDEAQARLQMHNMGQNDGEAVALDPIKTTWCNCRHQMCSPWNGVISSLGRRRGSQKASI